MKNLNTEAVLIDYLYDNRSELLEHWVSSLVLVGGEDDWQESEASCDVIEKLIYCLINFLEFNYRYSSDMSSFCLFRDRVFTCRPGMPACTEFYRSGKEAVGNMLSQMEEMPWEFSGRQLETVRKKLEYALHFVVMRESEACSHICGKEKHREHMRRY